jgi:flagellar basal-body rod protein FlgG
MNDSLYIAATGMQAQQQTLDTIANNLANVNTPGFKKGRVNFQEIMQVQTSQHADPAMATPAGLGVGISVDSVVRDFSTGQIAPTGSAMDLAIDGDGFLEVTLADGSHAYTRGGTLQVNKDGFLATADGAVLKPAIHVSADTNRLVISPDGKVTLQTAQGGPVDAGQIELARFVNPSALHPEGNGLYSPTEASGLPLYGKPATGAFGKLAQASVESSNVSLVDEMVTLMVAQRAYELSSKVVQASDELMSLTNNLRRG